MNYNRIQWERKHPKRKNPYAQELELKQYRPRRRESKDKNKLNPRTIENLIDNDN